MTTHLPASAIQQALGVLGLYTGKIDGILGKGTRKGIDQALGRPNGPKDDWQPWGDDRRITAFEQMLCRDVGIEVGEIDGQVGPQTLHAFEAFNSRGHDKTVPNAAVEAWRDTLPAEQKPIVAPTGLTEKRHQWPKQSGVPSFFGAVGQNWTTVEWPYPLTIAWDTSKTTRKVSLHQKVVDSGLRVANQIAKMYSPTQIKQLRLDRFGGSGNVRKMRGGSAMSMHSWAIAIDWDPERNQLKFNRKLATLDDPDYNGFWAAWESEGWTSLGRWRDFDWMHVQATSDIFK